MYRYMHMFLFIHVRYMYLYPFFFLSLSMETPGARSFAGLKVAFLIRSHSLENQTSLVQLQNEEQVALGRLQKVSYDILLRLRT